MQTSPPSWIEVIGTPTGCTPNFTHVIFLCILDVTPMFPSVRACECKYRHICDNTRLSSWSPSPPPTPSPGLLCSVPSPITLKLLLFGHQFPPPLPRLFLPPKLQSQGSNSFVKSCGPSSGWWLSHQVAASCPNGWISIDFATGASLRTDDTLNCRSAEWLRNVT